MHAPVESTNSHQAIWTPLIHFSESGHWSRQWFELERQKIIMWLSLSSYWQLTKASATQLFGGVAINSCKLVPCYCRQDPRRLVCRVHGSFWFFLFLVVPDGCPCCLPFGFAEQEFLWRSCSLRWSRGLKIKILYIVLHHQRNSRSISGCKVFFYSGVEATATSSSQQKSLGYTKHKLDRGILKVRRNQFRASAKHPKPHDLNGLFFLVCLWIACKIWPRT
jgi:hypothetical protein